LEFEETFKIIFVELQQFFNLSREQILINPIRRYFISEANVVLWWNYHYLGTFS